MSADIHLPTIEPSCLRRAAFFDRDGVLIHDVGYPHREEQLTLMDGAAEAVRRLNRAGHLVVIVTNQSGVARGYFSEQQMHDFNDRLVSRLFSEGARVDAVYACPFHENAADPVYFHPDHPDRKPNPGMLHRAAHDLPIDLSRSFLIGDRESDLEAARRAQVVPFLFTGGNLSSFLDENGLIG